MNHRTRLVLKLSALRKQPKLISFFRGERRSTWHTSLPPNGSMSNITRWKLVDPTSGEIPHLCWFQKSRNRLHEIKQAGTSYSLSKTPADQQNQVVVFCGVSELVNKHSSMNLPLSTDRFWIDGRPFIALVLTLRMGFQMFRNMLLLIGKFERPLGDELKKKLNCTVHIEPMPGKNSKDNSMTLQGHVDRELGDDQLHCRLQGKRICNKWQTCLCPAPIVCYALFPTLVSCFPM